MKQVPDILIDSAMQLAEEAVLSPESYVFVALMSVEEGPNKASFIVLAPDFGPAREGAA